MKNLLAVSTAALLLGACAIHQGVPEGARDLATAPYKTSVQRGLLFTPPDWPEKLRADIWLPRGIGPYAAIVLVHGNSWAGGDRGDMAGIAEALARKGYIAISIDYRLAPQYKFPAALQDAQVALRWVRTHADSYGIDPQRIGVLGYAGGAQIAGLLGTISDGDPLDIPYGGPGARVQAVVAGAMPADLRDLADSDDVTRYLGTTFSQNQTIFETASPLTHVSPGDAPFFLYHGGWDQEIPLSQSEHMKTALDQAGVPAEIYIIQGLGHMALPFFDGGMVDQAIHFLDRHLRNEP